VHPIPSARKGKRRKMIGECGERRKERGEKRKGKMCNNFSNAVCK